MPTTFFSFASYPHPSLRHSPKPLNPRPHLHLPRAASRRSLATGGEDDDSLLRLVGSGSLDEALLLVDSMSAPPVGPCTELIDSLCREMRVAEAARVLADLEACGAADVVAYNTMIDGYCSCGQVDAAHCLIASMAVAPNASTFRPVMRGLCDLGRVDDAHKMLDYMLHKGCSPDTTMYGILLNATWKKSGYRQAMGLLDEMRAKGCSPDVLTYSTILHCFCEEGRVDSAIELLNSMPSYGCDPNVLSYNIVLEGLRSAGRWNEALKILSTMPSRGCKPDAISYIIVLLELSNAGQLEDAIKLLNSMSSYGTTSSMISYLIVLEGMRKAERWEDAKALMATMERDVCPPHKVTLSTFINFLCHKEPAEILKEMLGLLPPSEPPL